MIAVKKNELMQIISLNEPTYQKMLEELVSKMDISLQAPENEIIK